MLKRLLLFSLVAVRILAQPTLPNAVPMPTPEIQYLGVDGQPLAGAKLCTYAAGTSTPLATYTSSTAGSSNTNPIILDQAGRASVWIGPQLYKFVLRTGGTGSCNDGTVVWTQDNVADTTLYFANFVKTVGTSTMITYVCGGAGCVSRTVASKLSDTLDIKDFGAVGDGTTNDTVAIQAAIDYATSSGRVLHITSSTVGCYRTEATLTVISGLTIQGGYPDGIAPQICYYGDPADDVIQVGAAMGNVAFRVVLDGFAITCPTGCETAVHLERSSEGEVNVTIGNASYPNTIAVGVYCDQCFIGTVSSYISWVGTGIWFNTPGPLSTGFVTVRGANIFETTKGIRISQGVNVLIKDSYIENFDVGIQFDNACGLAGCVVNNVVVSGSNFTSVAAANHHSPIPVKYVVTDLTPANILSAYFYNNLFFATPTGGGTSEYVFDFDMAACAGCPANLWLYDNNIESGSVSSLHATGGNVIMADQGGNYYRSSHNGSERPNSEISSGTTQFTRWDFRQYQVYDPQLSGGRTLMTVKAALNQPNLTSIIETKGNDGNNDLEYYGRTALAWQADTAFAWQKMFGAEDPNTNVLYGFGTFGLANALGYLFTGSDRNSPWQTWFPATGNTAIGDTVTDNGTKLQVKGNLSVTEGYGPTTNLGNTNLLQIGAKGAGSPYSASVAWGDGTGYTLAFGPVITGTFTPKAIIVDNGMIGSVGILFASLGAPAVGRSIYCTDCTIGSTCSGSGSGAWAFRSAGGVWKCPF